jgi:LL-diaminopimelate aminotransferase
MEHLTAHFFATLGARIAALRAAGADVIRLDEGAPDMPPAPEIIQALSASAAQPERHSYQPQRGTAALRQAWAEMYRRVHGVTLDAETQITPLLGSKEGIFHLSMMTLQTGDAALIPDPGYITYTRGALFAGAEPIHFPLLPERGYLPDLEAIPAAAVRRARLLWLNYPNNPTGGVAELAFFQQAVEFARRHHLLVVHDAAYTQITYDGYRAPSLLEIPGALEVALEFNTLSKSHNMAGWRVGAAAGNPEVIRRLFTLKTNVDSGHFLPIMEAATAAMTGDQAWLEPRNRIYQERRDVILSGLRAAGLPVEAPRGSLYIWCPAPPGWNGLEFSQRLLEEAHVSLTPGVVFGQRGENHVRIAVAAPAERCAEAMSRLGAWARIHAPR